MSGRLSRKLEDLAVGKDLAAVIVVRVAFLPKHGFVDAGGGPAIENGNGAGVHKAADSCAIRGFEQIACAGHVGAVERLPVAAAPVVLAKEGSGIEEDVDAGERGREARDVVHVTRNNLNRNASELDGNLIHLLRTHQSANGGSLAGQEANEIAAKKANAAGNKGRLGHCALPLPRKRTGRTHGSGARLNRDGSSAMSIYRAVGESLAVLRPTASWGSKAEGKLDARE